MMLVERGKIRLRDPVAKYIPEFGRNGKEKITVFQLLTHQAGLVPDNRLTDYEPEGLQEAMETHRYGLQCLIYTLALHRYLRRRVPGYQYATHFGGAYYLFLRGMRPDSGMDAGVWFDRPDSALVERLDGLFREDDPREEGASSDGSRETGDPKGRPGEKSGSPGAGREREP